MKKFYKVTDMEDKPFTFVEVTKTDEGDVVKLAERNTAADRVSFREVADFNQRDFTGKVSEIDADAYAVGLQEWGVGVGNAPALSVDEPAAATPAGDAGKPTEGEPSTSTPAPASDEVGGQQDAGSTVSGGDVTPEAEPTSADEAQATGEGMPEKKEEAA